MFTNSILNKLIKIEGREQKQCQLWKQSFCNTGLVEYSQKLQIQNHQKSADDQTDKIQQTPQFKRQQQIDWNKQNWAQSANDSHDNIDQLNCSINKLNTDQNSIKNLKFIKKQLNINPQVDVLCIPLQNQKNQVIKNLRFEQFTQILNDTEKLDYSNILDTKQHQKKFTLSIQNQTELIKQQGELLRLQSKQKQSGDQCSEQSMQFEKLKQKMFQIETLALSEIANLKEELKEKDKQIDGLIQIVRNSKRTSEERKQEVKKVEIGIQTLDYLDKDREQQIKALRQAVIRHIRLNKQMTIKFFQSNRFSKNYHSDKIIVNKQRQQIKHCFMESIAQKIQI